VSPIHVFFYIFQLIACEPPDLFIDINLVTSNHLALLILINYNHPTIMTIRSVLKYYQKGRKETNGSMCRATAASFYVNTSLTLR